MPAPGYMKSADGQLCSDIGRLQVSSQSHCEEAAAALELDWGDVWDGAGDFPACIHANDGRNSVFYNSSPEPATSANNPHYASICLKSSGTSSIV